MDPITLETYARLRWFIKLRWAAIAATFLTALFFQELFHLSLFNLTLMVMLISLVGCNGLFIWLLQLLPIINLEKRKKIFTPSGFANLQIGLDLVFLTVLWHNYGGIENPIMFFFIFHMIIASILLPKFNSYLWALGSSLAIMLVAFLEFSGVIDHHPILFQITGIVLWNNLYWNIFLLSAFCFTLICVVYMTSSISLKLRERNEEIIGLEKEIAEKKLQDTEKKLFFSEKMAALGKLAAGMAHEINNPLTTILSYSECLLDEVEANKSQQGDLQLIIKETIRIRGIVKQILNFARSSDTVEPEPVDLHSELLELVDMLQAQMDFIDIIFQLNLGNKVPPAGMGKEHFEQIMINLLVNAAQAMGGKGTIALSTLYDEKHQKVILECCDNGPGISTENLSRVFDPFFTTKALGKGTGLGLSVSYGLIKMYEGTITARNNQDRGVTFTVSLPAAQSLTSG